MRFPQGLFRIPSAVELAGMMEDTQSPGYGCNTPLDVDEFTTKYGLDDIREQLRRAALPLDDPGSVARIENLSNEELGALSREIMPKCTSHSFFTKWWSMPVACHIGGLAYGVVEGTLWFPLQQQSFQGGARLTMFHEYFPVTGGALIGCWLMVIVNMLVGRRWTLLIATIVKFTASIGIMLAPKLSLLRLFRVIAAIGSGAITCTLPMYLGEISAATKRGAMISSWQLNVYLGTSLAILYRYFLEERGIHIASIVTTVVLLGCFTRSPPSPYDSARRGNMRKAYGTLRQYRETDIQSARDLYKIYSRNFAGKDRKLRSAVQAPVQFLLSPSTKRALLASTTMMISRIVPDIIVTLTWIQGLYLSPEALGVGLFIGIVFLALFLLYCRALSVSMTDCVGRRRLTLISMLLMLVALGIAVPGGYIMNPMAVGIVARLLFHVPYVLSDVVPLTYAAEVFPFSQRELGMAAVVSVYYVKDAVVQFVVTLFMEIQNPYGYIIPRTFVKSALFFGILHLVILVGVFFLTRETGGYPLEEIYAVFDPSTRNLAAYRTMIWMPYIWRKYVLRQQVVLESFEESVYGGRLMALEAGSVVDSDEDSA